MCSILSLFLVCIWYGFMPSCFFLLKKMYNCIIIFITFILYLLEKDLKTFCVANVKYVLCGSWARFLFSEVVILGNCNLVLYYLSK